MHAKNDTDPRRYLYPLQALSQIRRRHFYQGTRTKRTRLRS